MTNFPKIVMGLSRSTLRLTGLCPQRLNVDLCSVLRGQLFKLKHARRRDHVLPKPPLHRALPNPEKPGDRTWPAEWSKGVSDAEHGS